MKYKIQVFLTLETEVAERFDKEENKAGLINELLTRHYDNSKLKALGKDKIEQLIALVHQKDALEAKYEAIKNGKI